MKLQSGLWKIYTTVVSALLLLYSLVHCSSKHMAVWKYFGIYLLEFWHVTKPNREEKHPPLVGAEVMITDSRNTKS
jgi:hypothetical protein